MLTRLPSASTLTLTLAADGATVRATLSSDADVDDWPSTSLLESLSWKVIAGLVGHATAERDADGRPAIVLRKSTLAPTDP